MLLVAEPPPNSRNSISEKVNGIQNYLEHDDGRQVFTH